MLGDLDYKLCETALMELFATHTYPPQISEIREKCAEYTVPHLKDQGEAWGEVQKAISQYGYYRQEEALESLTPIVREAVKRLGFREICLDEKLHALTGSHTGHRLREPCAKLTEQPEQKPTRK